MMLSPTRRNEPTNPFNSALYFVMATKRATQISIIYSLKLFLQEKLLNMERERDGLNTPNYMSFHKEVQLVFPFWLLSFKQGNSGCKISATSPKGDWPYYGTVPWNDPGDIKLQQLNLKTGACTNCALATSNMAVRKFFTMLKEGESGAYWCWYFTREIWFKNHGCGRSTTLSFASD